MLRAGDILLNALKRGVEVPVGSVLFVYICGFTAITERVPAKKVVGLINRYFDLMVKEIIARGDWGGKTEKQSQPCHYF